MSVNVYGYDKIPYPYYISEFVKKLYHVDVLLHNNHYYLIRNMSTFASGEKVTEESVMFVSIVCVILLRRRDMIFM